MSGACASKCCKRASATAERDPTSTSAVMSVSAMTTEGERAGAVEQLGLAKTQTKVLLPSGRWMYGTLDRHVLSNVAEDARERESVLRKERTLRRPPE